MKRNRRLSKIRLTAFRALAWCVAIVALITVLARPYEPVWTQVGAAFALGLMWILRSNRNPQRRTRRGKRRA